jgi:hypothetical protein
MASSSRGQQRVEDVYEQQNDQRLDELHSKLRTLKGVRALYPRASLRPANWSTCRRLQRTCTQTSSLKTS